MILINVYNQSRFPVKVNKIKKTIQQTLEKQGIVSDSQVSVALVSDEKMAELVKEYYKEKKTQAHPVLSFPANEITKPFVFPPDGKMHLGEIVVAYPWAVEKARKEGKLIDEVVCELAEHGALHLVGVHHQ
jgi:probable rRNA maturation factor